MFNLLLAISLQMTPLPEEQLDNPVNLTQDCQKVQIQEWRATAKLSNTIPSEMAVKVMDQACHWAVKNFPAFVTARGYQLDNYYSPTVHLSIIPADLNHHGADPRNLNDIIHRFSTRTQHRDQNGEVIPIWGYFQRSTLHIYLRNDILLGSVININFIHTFIHEMFHAMSWQFGIFSQHRNSPETEEEQLAEQFANLARI